MVNISFEKSFLNCLGRKMVQDVQHAVRGRAADFMLGWPIFVQQIVANFFVEFRSVFSSQTPPGDPRLPGPWGPKTPGPLGSQTPGPLGPRGPKTPGPLGSQDFRAPGSQGPRVPWGPILIFLLNVFFKFFFIFIYEKNKFMKNH